MRKLVDLHGGTVEAHSEGLGKGSVFVVRLPEAQAEKAEKDGGTKIDIAASASRRILVVDDSADIADSLSSLLSLLGHEVVVAMDGPSALKRVEEFGPEVVLLDLGMPGMDGYELARRLRSHDSTKHAHFAALTGYDKTRDRELARKAGFNAYFVKPVDLNVLQDFLQECANTSNVEQFWAI